MKNLSSPHIKNSAWGLRIMAVVLFLIFSVFPIQSANPLSVLINEITWPVKTAYAANGPKTRTMVINEIAWTGTKVEEVESKNWWRYEWFELYNNTDQLISSDNWRVEFYRTALDWSLELKGSVPAQSYFLVVASDKISPNYDLNYSNLGGKFVNGGQKLLLKDGDGRIIDEIDCSSGWFAGDNESKQTMERKNSQISGNTADNWQNSQNPGGTPKAQNSIVLTETPEPTEETQETKEKIAEVGSLPTKPTEDKPAENGSPSTYPGGIVFNEILPSPEGPDETEEWIEIFNQNSFGIDLSGWKIIDEIGKTTTFTFPAGTKIGPNGFLVLFRPTTNITLNNSSDGLLLIQPNGNVLDTMTYEKAPRGQSYNRTDSGWLWSSTLTPGLANFIPVLSSESGQKVKAEGQGSKTGKESLEKEEISASVGRKFLAGPGLPSMRNDTWIFMTASILAIFCGITILILKKRLKMS